MITIKPFDEVYVKIVCDDDIAYEINDAFSFKIKNYRFHPLVKNKKWDGVIHIFNLRKRLLYKGMIHYVESFAKARGYTCIVSHELLPNSNFTKHDAETFVASLNLPKEYELRDYQLESFSHCIRNNRALFISPTGSGKSMIIYWLLQYYRQRTLLIVDTINLLNQMYSDLADYGLDVEKYVQRIPAKKVDKNKPIVISTYQSAVRKSPEWHQQFGLVIGDEAQRYSSASCKKIMESLTKCKYRFGFSGSLDGSETNQMVLEGLFGAYKKIVSTRELIDQNFLSQLSIKCIVLQYSKEECKFVKQHHKMYQSEYEYLCQHQKRNRFIKNLALSLKGNTIVMFQRVETHGVPLFAQIQAEAKVPTYFVSGKVDGDERERIRKIVNTHKDSITVSSVGTFSQGVNIPNINNIIVASPTKSQIRVFQTIGRGLRKSETKYHCVLYDIVDDLHYKSRLNYTLKHFKERLEMYCTEQFDYSIMNVPF